VLLVGLPRSGTTWIGKIFDSHPQTLYLHEPDSAIPLKEIPLILDSAVNSMNSDEVRAALARTFDVRLARVAGSLPRFRKAYRSQAVDWLHRRLALVVKLNAKLFREGTLPDLIGNSPPCPPHFVWKSIESVGRIALLARVMPHLRIIHILRHPCGWIASQARGHSEGKFHTERDDWWRFDLLARSPPAQRRGITAEWLWKLGEFERDAWSWILWNENGAEGCDTLHNVAIVKYEDVCSDPIAKAKQMFEFAGLQWNPQSEAFIRQSVTIHRADYYTVFRNPLSTANNWRHQFSPEGVSTVEAIMSQSALGRMYLTS
jgi:hypothetical protein